MKIIKLLPVAALFFVLGCQHVAPAPPPMVAAPPPGMLQSPWDATPVALSDIPYECGPITPVGVDITVSGGLDGDKRYVSEDVKAAVYSQSTDAVLDLVSRVVKAADTYRNTGSKRAAQCVNTLLYAAAAQHAITGYMASAVAWMERDHALRAFAIAWLKVRGSGTASQMETDTVITWLEDLVRLERDHYERLRCSPHICYVKNHKGLSVAMSAAAIGVAANDFGLFHWAMGEYHSAVGTINDRGMLHYDTRGRYAFKNNLSSAGSLVQIAEFGEANAYPLYGYDNGAIHLLVHTVALGIVSQGPYKTVTKDSQVAPKTVEPWEIAWASVYDRRFPDPVVTSLLQQVGPGGVDMWGGEPWDPSGDPDEPGM